MSVTVTSSDKERMYRQLNNLSLHDHSDVTEWGLAERALAETPPFPVSMVLRSKAAPSGCNTNILRKSITARQTDHLSVGLKTFAIEKTYILTLEHNILGFSSMQNVTSRF